MLITITAIEQRLLDVGFDAMTVTEKNQLISFLANNAGKMYSEISVDDVIAHHKELKFEQLSEACADTILAGFTSTNGHVYRTNGDDQSNFFGKAIQLLLDSSITTIKWKTEDIGYADHTRDDWIQKVFLEGLSFKESTLYKYNQLKAIARSATSDAGVLAVRWS